MNSKKIFFAVLLSLLVAAGLRFKFSRIPRPTVPVVVETDGTNSSTKLAPLATNEVSHRSPTQTPANASVIPVAAPSPTVESLQALAMNNDAASLQTILTALTHSDPQIRDAAKDAAVQFGDRRAAVPLRAAAAQLDNLEEKVAWLAAADYLELPPLEIHSVTNPISR